MDAWNKLKPESVKKHKDAILAYIEISGGGTYEQIHSGLNNEVGHAVKLPTVVGRLSDLSNEENSPLDTSAEVDGKTFYRLKSGQTNLELK